MCRNNTNRINCCSGLKKYEVINKHLECTVPLTLLRGYRIFFPVLVLRIIFIFFLGLCWLLLDDRLVIVTFGI